MSARKSIRTIEEIDAAIVAKRQELREFRRGHRGWFREGLHEQVDARVAEAAAEFEAHLAHGANALDGVQPLRSPGRPGLLDLAALWALAHDTALHKRLHEHVDGMDPALFPTLSRDEAERRDDALAGELAALEKERAELERAARYAELDAEYEAVG